jgi:hypothetical protein
MVGSGVSEASRWRPFIGEHRSKSRYRPTDQLERARGFRRSQDRVAGDVTDEHRIPGERHVTIFRVDDAESFRRE